MQFDNSRTGLLIRLQTTYIATLALVNPPSTSMFVPQTFDDSELRRKLMTLACSCGQAYFLKGTFSAIFVLLASTSVPSGKLAIMSGVTVPWGEMELQRIPYFP